MCIDIIEESRKFGENILVHCMCGVSRSVTIILSYLIYTGKSLKDSLMFVKELRKNQYTQPNIGFFKQLLTFEKNKFDVNSITLNEYVRYIKFNN